MISDRGALQAQDLDPMHAPLRALPFVKGIHLAPGRMKGPEVRLKINSPTGVASFTVEAKKRSLDRSVVATLAATARRPERAVLALGPDWRLCR